MNKEALYNTLVLLIARDKTTACFRISDIEQPLKIDIEEDRTLNIYSYDGYSGSSALFELYLMRTTKGISVGYSFANFNRLRAISQGVDHEELLGSIVRGFKKLWRGLGGWNVGGAEMKKEIGLFNTLILGLVKKDEQMFIQDELGNINIIQPAPYQSESTIAVVSLGKEDTKSDYLEILLKRTERRVEALRVMTPLEYCRLPPVTDISFTYFLNPLLKEHFHYYEQAKEQIDKCDK